MMENQTEDMLRFPRMDSTVTLTPMAKATALTTRRTRGWRGFLPSPPPTPSIS